MRMGHVAAVVALIASATMVATMVDAMDVLSNLRDIPSSAGLTAPPKPTTFPSHILDRLNGRENQWDKLSPALQRAILWDGGLVAMSSGPEHYVQVYVPCGHTMNDVFIDLERMQLFDQADYCKLHTPCIQNTINFATTQCFIDSISSFTRCGIDTNYLSTLPTDKGDVYPAWSQSGTISKAFDPQIFRRIGPTKQSNGTESVSIFTIVEEPTIQILRTVDNDGCPIRASFVTPCRPLAVTEFIGVSKQWCVPDPQLGLKLWLEKDMLSTTSTESGSTSIQIVLVVLMTLATVGCVVLLFLLYRKEKQPVSIEYPSNQYFMPKDSPQFYFSHSHASTHRSSPMIEIEAINDSYRQQSKQLSDFCADPSLALKRVRYQSIYFHQCIVTGTNGQVWRGEYQGQDVVIKQTFAAQGRSSIHLHTLESFTCEIRLASCLDHPNIVGFIGFSWRLLPELCMLSEFMSFGDLCRFLLSNEGKLLRWKDDKITIACDIANALVYLHSLVPMVIHRDLKSSNVLLNEHLTAKLSDFGLSREQSFDATMTKGVGTMLWSAPEILRGERYNEKVDIYSFGMILTELDTHLPPYALNPEIQPVNSKSSSLTSKIAKGEIQPNVRKDCPVAIQHLITQCLSLDPNDRPTAMQVMYTLHSKIRNHQ